MQELLVAIRDIGREGQTFSVENQDVWLKPIQEFGLSCRIVKPMSAEIFVLPEDEGVLLRGTVRGEVALPCDRCSEETLVSVAYSFDEFEDYPQEEQDEAQTLLAGQVLVWDKKVLKLNLADLVWEEFSLALPTKPLCRADCKGVCPQCGKNLNEGPCSCVDTSGDLRLAALRNLKVQ